MSATGPGAAETVNAASSGLGWRPSLFRVSEPQARTLPRIKTSDAPRSPKTRASRLTVGSLLRERARVVVRSSLHRGRLVSSVQDDIGHTSPSPLRGREALADARLHRGSKIWAKSLGCGGAEAPPDERDRNALRSRRIVSRAGPTTRGARREVILQVRRGGFSPRPSARAWASAR